MSGDHEDANGDSSRINVVVLGATGVVGFGICDAWLKDGDATVFAVDRNGAALGRLAEKLGLVTEEDQSRLVTVVGDFSSSEYGATAKRYIDAALSEHGDGHLTHVVTAMGCTAPAPTGDGVSSSDAFHRIKSSYEQVFYPNLLATTLFLDQIRNVEGASFTVAGGPFTHHCPDAELYNVSLMGGTLNHFGTILAANTKDSKCRGNTLCCHYAIAYPDELDKSNPSSSFGELLDKDFGPVTDCRDWGKAFVRVARGTERSGFICMHDAEEAAILVKSKEWKWFPDQNKYGPVY